MPPKVQFVCNLGNGIHWDVYLDEIYRGSDSTLTAAVERVYAITGKEVWGGRSGAHRQKEIQEERK